MRQISVLIVEDQIEHQMFLNTVVHSDTDFKSMGIIRNGSAAITEIIQKKPDVVLLDLGLPDMDGQVCIKHASVKSPNTKFLICTVHEEDEKIFEALKAGAHGYVLKKNKPYQIIDAIKEVFEGESPMSSVIAAKVLNMLPFRNEDPKPTQAIEYHITRRQADILNLLAKGHSYQEIADTLFISVKTLKWHVYTIYKKLRATNRTEAINAYFREEDSEENLPEQNA